MRKVHVNYNDGNQISLVQQRSMRPREKFEIKERAGSKDYPLAFGLLKVVKKKLLCGFMEIDVRIF